MLLLDQCDRFQYFIVDFLGALELMMVCSLVALVLLLASGSVWRLYVDDLILSQHGRTVNAGVVIVRILTNRLYHHGCARIFR